MSLHVGETLIPGIRVHQTTGTGAGNYQQKTAVPSLSQQIITADSGYDALSRVTIAAMSTATQATPSLSIDTTTGVITATSTQTAGYVAAGTTTDTLSLSTIAGTTITPTNNVQVAVSARTYTLGQIQVAAVPSETITITANGTYTPSSGKWFSSVTVNVPTGTIVNNEPNRTVTPGVTQQIITPASGYNGLSQVTVNAISPINTAGDLIIAANAVTVPAGYYETNVIGTVDNAVLGSITTSRTKSNGKLVTTSTYSNFSAGFLASHSNVVTEQTLQTETVTPNRNTQTITPTSNSYYLESVTVNPIPSQYIIPTGSQNITANNTYDVTGLAEVVVNVPTGSTIHNQNKTVTPTESQQTVNADSGYSGLGTVTVNAISSSYVGSGIDRRTDADFTLTGDILDIPAGYYANDENFTIPADTVSYTANGTYTPSAGRWISQVTVNVQPNNQNKTITPTTSQQTITADSGYTGLGTVTVNRIPTQYIIPSGSQTVTSNNTYDVTNLAELIVNVGSTINNQNKTVTPSESVQSITADSGYSGLGTVTVNAISSTYIGSDIPQKTWNVTDSWNETLKHLVISAQSGYYASDLALHYEGKTLPNATITVSNTGLITSTTTLTTSTRGVYKDQSKATTSQLSTQAGTTITPTESQQVAVAAGKYTLGDVIVDAISDTYVGSAINARTSSDLYGTLVSNYYTVTTPAGYYSTDAIFNITRQTGSGITTSINGNYYEINYESGYYNSGTKNITLKTLSSPSISIDADGLITASLTISAANAGPYKAQTASATSQLTTQGATTAIPNTTEQTIATAGTYLTGDIKVAAISASTLTNTIINGTAFEETTGDYGFRVSVNIPAGYHNAGTITKDFSTILPAPQTEGTSAQVLIGYDLYNHEGELISGNMANNGTWNRTLDDNTLSVTIPAGYHNGSGTVSHTTVAVPNPTFSFNASTRTITASGNWTKGYTTNNSYSNTYVIAAGSVTAPNTISGSSATKSTGTNTLTLTKTISITPTVTTAGYISTGTANNVEVSLSTTVTTMAAQTIIPSTATVSLQSGTYLTGAVQIQGDSDLIAENIKDGVSIFGVTGTYTGTAPTIRELTITPSENTQTYDGVETLISQASKFSGSSTRTLSTPLTIGATYTVKYYEATESQTMSGNLTPSWIGTFVCAATQNLDNNRFTLTTTTVTFNNNYWDYYKVEIYTPAADGFLPVTVSAIPSNYVIPTGTLNITSNNTYDVSSYASAVVNIPSSTPILQAKTGIVPSTSSQTITADSGYDGLSSVQINAMPTGTATAPTTLTISSPTRGTTGASLNLTANVSITPRITTAGYISTGTAGTTAVTINTDIAMKYAMTYTPTTSDQTIVTGYYIAGVQTIKGDSNLLAGNIKNGVSIFGVTGNYTGGTTTIEPLTVTPTESQQSYPVGTNMTVIATRNRQGDNSGETTWTIDLASTMTNGEAFNIAGTLWTYFSGGHHAQASIDETFTWDGQSHTFTTTGTKTSGTPSGTVTYTVTVNTNNIVTTLSAPSSWTTYGPSIAKNITISRGVAYPDGYGPITVNAIPSTYKNLTDTTSAVAADIAEGETAYTSNGVLLTGSMHIVTYYTGGSAPSSSLGNNGDIYLQS